MAWRMGHHTNRDLGRPTPQVVVVLRACKPFAPSQLQEAPALPLADAAPAAPAAAEEEEALTRQMGSKAAGIARGSSFSPQKLQTFAAP
eukprot:7824418-Alexandrium_andersonii.AAC.1